MKRLQKIFFVLLAWLCLPLGVKAQYCEPSAIYVTVANDTLDDASTDQDAPLVARFFANPKEADGLPARYEWKIWNIDNPNEILVHRFDQDFEYTFEESGRFQVQLYASFTVDGETYNWPEEARRIPLP